MTEQREKRRCKNCVFWRWHGKLTDLEKRDFTGYPQDVHTGDCVCRPPVVPTVHMVVGDDPPGGVSAIWPVTLGKDYCGGHRITGEKAS